MSTMPAAELPGSSGTGAEDSGRQQWYAVWTRSRQEKSAAAILSVLDVHHFLPLKHEVRQWSDRRQAVTVPLFSGYLFVRMNLSKESRLRVLNTAGIVGFVGNQTGPSPIPDLQIQSIRTVVETRTECQVVPLLQEGDRVRILRGPLSGIEGILVRSNSSVRVSISIEMIHKSLMVSVSRDDVELVDHHCVEPLLLASRDPSGVEAGKAS